ncbi:hypothetical protein N7E02_17150 [Aliirhizobium terrae]|uniref:hypothetical protein n=1 Tax=Terrirhizobium terrae TaxID=2926709 RepID=UPI002575A1FE|nr:hypothetical protein [Rhizobium sp. CC-CFT758]WJH41945.1 hypothetical protein N7E02_17150 [Rhizobium sp. CC-CFT758]
MIRPPIRPHGTARPSLPLWLAGVLVAAVLCVGAFTVFENYNSAIREGEARAVSSAHVVAAHMEWMMEASDLALRRIEVAIGGRPIDSSADLITDLERAVGELPAGFQYALLDQDGQMRYSSAADSSLPDHGERAYFRRLKEGQEPSPSAACSTTSAPESPPSSSPGGSATVPNSAASPRSPSRTTISTVSGPR